MNEVIEQELKIENMIYEIRGKQVMLASDVAKLYNSETKIINQVVKRNINRFPETFCFQLTTYECAILRSQFVTSSKEGNTNEMNYAIHGGNRYLPYVFTEHGIIMLSGLLKSDIAARVNIQIINAFVKMKKYITNNNYEQRLSNIETKLIDYDNNFKELFNKFDTKINNDIFFAGEVYDAYSVMLDIFNRSKESIVIIDNYIDKNILDILAKTKKEVFVITNKYNRIDFDKYCKQYGNVKIKISNEFHDRFIIIDKKYLYHCGASFKDLGKKCFAITEIKDSKIIDEILKYIHYININMV